VLLQLIAITTYKKSSSALIAAPEDGEMAYVGPEPVLLEQGVPQGQEWGFSGLCGGAAPLADQVVVVTLFGGVIAKSSAPQIDLRYQSQVLQ